MKIKKYLQSFFILMIHIGCQSENMEYLSLSPRTVLIYMGGDNNLTTETDAKISALSSGWNHPESRLIIYQDNGIGSRLLEVIGQGRVNTIRTYQEENSASMETLRRVVGETMSLYPADSYGLLVFSHGTGWLPAGLYSHPRSVVTDDKNEMEITEFSEALNGYYFDFIIFEACLMAGVEVAWELRDKTSYIVASAAEILSPGFTDIYAELRDCLFLQEPDLINFARKYYDHYNEKRGKERSATVSVIYTGRMMELADAARPILENRNTVDPASVGYFDGSHMNTYLYSDLADYLRLKSNSLSEYTLFERELEKTVTFSASTPSFLGRQLTAHSGLSVYIPRPSYPELNLAYQQTGWCKEIMGKWKIRDTLKK